MPKITILGETLSFQKKEEKKGENLLMEVLLNRQTLHKFNGSYLHVDGQNQMAPNP
jgi:hypothetical protein